MSFFKNLTQLFFKHGIFFAITLSLLLFTAWSILSVHKNGVWIIFILYSFFTLLVATKLDYIGLFTALWSLSYSVLLVSGGIRPYNDAIMVAYLLGPIAFYRLGKWFPVKLRGDEGQLQLVLFLIILFFSLKFYMVSVVDIASSGIIATSRRMELEGYKAYQATGFGLIADTGIAGLGVYFASLFIKGRENTYRYLFLAMGCLSMVCSLHLLNRSCFVIGIISILVMLMYYQRKSVWKIILGLLVVIAFVYVIYNSIEGTDDLLKAFETRNRIRGYGTASAGGRTWRWLDAIERVFYMPFGWAGNESLTGYNYVHNFWLDVGRETGLLPFLFLVIATILATRKLFLLFKEQANPLIALLIGLNICFFLGAFIEPIMEANPYFIFLYIFIWGIQTSYYNIIKQRKTEELADEITDDQRDVSDESEEPTEETEPEPDTAGSAE